MSDDQIEEMLRDLIEQHLADESREAARDWLDRRVNTYRAMRQLGPIDEDE